VGDEERADDLVGVEGRGLGDEELRRALAGVPAGAAPRQKTMSRTRGGGGAASVHHLADARLAR
jgi:hypothetical protein